MTFSFLSQLLRRFGYKIKKMFFLYWSKTKIVVLGSKLASLFAPLLLIFWKKAACQAVRCIPNAEYTRVDSFASVFVNKSILLFLSVFLYEYTKASVSYLFTTSAGLLKSTKMLLS